jgi:hypothetical protein
MNKRFLVLPAAFFLFLSVQILFSFSPKLTGLSFKAGVLSDSNPFSLSDSETFPIAKESDFAPFLGTDIEARILRTGGYTLRGSFSAFGTFYLENTAKSNFSVSPKLTLLRKGAWLSFSYAYSPKNVIRPVLDTDTGIYRFPAYHRNSLLLRSGVNPIDKLWAEFQAERGLNFYDEYFPEYDRKSWKTGFALRYSGDIYARAGYDFTKAVARAIDTQGEDRLLSDETDGSFDSDAFSASIGYSLSRFSARANFSHDTRYYTTKKSPSNDPFHASRIDRTTVLSLNLNYRLIPEKATIEAMIEHSQRDTESLVKRIGPNCAAMTECV